MPAVSITMRGGRPPEKKEELIRRVTDTIAETLGISKERVHIVLYEVPIENFGHGGVSSSKTML